MSKDRTIMYPLTRIPLIIATMLGLSACGLSGNLENELGYAAFESPGLLDTDQEFSLSLGRAPIRFARRFVDDDPEASAILEQLTGVQIKIYGIDANSEDIRQRLGRATDRLIEDGWTSMVAVREDDELASVLVWMDTADEIRGLALIAQDESELVFVNLIGRIQPELFSTYMAELDISALDIAIGTD